MQHSMVIISTFKKLGLHNRLAFFSLCLIVLQTVGLGLVASHYLQTNLEDQMGQRALAVAQSLESSTTIRRGLKTKNSDLIQAYIEPIRIKTGARFIVVGDVNGIRYSHPDPKKLGKKMVGGDNKRALISGHAYTSKAKGSLGVSLRGKCPIRTETGEIIGVISVGYLEEDISLVLGKFNTTFYYAVVVILFTGIFLTIYIAKRYRDDIFGLEPEEIARTYTERKAVLASILEAIIVTNELGIITSINPAALKLLGDIESDSVVGHNIEKLLPVFSLLDDGESCRDIEVEINDQNMILTKTPLKINLMDRGVVLTFRLKDEIVVLSKKLSQVQQFSTMLQVQTHEYSNKLNTIGGLIQIGSVDEALELITSESSGYQKLIEFLVNTVPDPTLAGFILGKYNVARERNIILEIEPDSSLNDVPEHLPREKLVTILGNLIDNAFDASLENKQTMGGQIYPIVKLHMTDIGNDLIFEIEDSGSGINIEVKDKIFSLGQTTKENMGHGIGMYLVKNCLNQLNGSISITQAQHGGTIMTVYIPKFSSQSSAS